MNINSNITGRSVISAKAYPFNGLYLTRVTLDDGDVFTGLRVVKGETAWTEECLQPYTGNGNFSVAYYNAADNDPMNRKPKRAFGTLSDTEREAIIAAAIRAVENIIDGGTGEIVLND